MGVMQCTRKRQAPTGVGTVGPGLLTPGWHEENHTAEIASAFENFAKGYNRDILKYDMNPLPRIHEAHVSNKIAIEALSGVELDGPSLVSTA